MLLRSHQLLVCLLAVLLGVPCAFVGSVFADSLYFWEIMLQDYRGVAGHTLWQTWSNFAVATAVSLILSLGVGGALRLLGYRLLRILHASAVNQ